MITWFKVEDEAQASALHQLSEVGIYDFWTEVSKIIWEPKQIPDLKGDYRKLYIMSNKTYLQ